MLASESKESSKTEWIIAEVRERGVIVLEEEAMKLRLFLQREVGVAESILTLAPLLKDSFIDCEVSLELFVSKSDGDAYPVFFLRKAQYEKGFMHGVRRFMQDHAPIFSSEHTWLAVTTDFRPPRNRV